jgi:hypothetical protein
MPPKRTFKRRRPIRRRRVYPSKGRFRNRTARIIRQPTLKPKSAVQKLVYYNTFFANNVLDANGAQQMLMFSMQLNSIYPFGANWNAELGTNVLNPNTAITGYGSTQATTLPGFADGYSLKNQYAKYLITGTKTTITANPMVDTTNVSNPAVLFAVKHTQNTPGLNAASKYSALQKLPNRFMKNIRQVGAYTSGVGGKLEIRHSVRKFNSKVDLEDCSNYIGNTGGNTGDADNPANLDRLTIGIVGKCDNPDTPLLAGKFCVNVKHEVFIRFSEMLEAGAVGGNYSFPKAAGTFKKSLGTYGAAIAGAYMLGI